MNLSIAGEARTWSRGRRMNRIEPLKQVRVWEGVSPEQFDREVRACAEPALLKNFVGSWPAVAAARNGSQSITDYLGSRAQAEPVPFVIAPHAADGRLHYSDNLEGFNFRRGEAPLAAILEKLGGLAEEIEPATLAAQGVRIDRCLAGFMAENPMPLVPHGTVARMWIGNAAKVAAHSDPSENIACVVAGRRRFTLFPPDQVGNLYMGPFEPTPAGTPVSMVDVTRPDLVRYPDFAKAMEVALVADMEPGDALYLPYHWFHHVEAFTALNILVNYWFNPARTDLGTPWDALMHGMMSLRGLPADQRRAWQAMFDHYVFLENGDPGEHLPMGARGILAAESPADIGAMRRQLITNLVQQEKQR